MTNRKFDITAAALAAAQHGAFSRRQLSGQGLPTRGVSRRIAASQWERLTPGVYAPLSAVSSWPLELAAALVAHPGAVVSHRSAAALHRWSGFPREPVELSSNYRANCRSLGKVHRTKDLLEQDITDVDGLPVTTELRTVIDLASLLRRRRLEWLLDDLLAAGTFTLDELTDSFRRITRRGKPGMANLRWFVESRGPGYVPPSSRLERLLTDVLAPLGPPLPIRQHPLPSRLGAGRVDLAYPDAKVIIEADSRRWHQRMADLENDRIRDDEAAALGWVTLRFTWKQLTERPDWVRQTVRAVLSSRANAPQS